MDATAPFRAATAADIPALLALVTGSYRGEGSRAGWTTEADLLDGGRTDAAQLHVALARPRSLIVVLDEADGLLACAQVAQVGDAAEFGMFAVRPTRQGAGIGTRLLGECERIAAAEWALPRMRMSVIDVRDELLAYYARRGYQRTAEVLPFPYGDPRFGLPRRGDLRFVVLEKPLVADAAA